MIYFLPRNRENGRREEVTLELNLTQKQTQTLSPQMMQSMEILEEAVQANAVREPEERYD